MGNEPTDEDLVAKGVCPACRAVDLHLGPRGGASTNFACFTCNARYNAAFVPGGLVFFERTGTIAETEKRAFRPTLLQDDTSEMVNEQSLRISFPWINWDEPIRISVPPALERLGCRYCIALDGLKGTEVAALPFDAATFAAHMRERHGRP